MQPRIYTYKITFEEIPHWYWGVHKEKRYNDGYMGSPVTHRWMWEFYTPKIQILEFFPCTDEGWKEASEVERRLILPDLNNPLCLNERCGPKSSRVSCSKGGVKGSAKTMQEKTGIHNPEFRESEEFKQLLLDNAPKGGQRSKELKAGFHSLSKEEKIENSRKGGSVGGLIVGPMNRDEKKGFFGLTKEEQRPNKVKGGEITGSLNKKLKRGIFAPGFQGPNRPQNRKVKCTITGKVSTPAGLTKFQRNRNIDVSNRVSVD
jgi:hypothetical protein